MLATASLTAQPSSAAARDAWWLKASSAAVWLLTGALVLHPLYWSVGAGYLGTLGLPVWLMPATCAAEIGIAVAVVALPPGRLLTALQVAMIVSFTLILSVAEPMLLASPFGVLTKNLPLLSALLVAWELGERGWTERAGRWLRWGMALIWLSEGLVPKVFFQQAIELGIAERSGLSFGHPSGLLQLIGLTQALSGLGALWLRGRPLAWLLALQSAALLALPLVVGAMEPWLWAHPFGPLTKNIPIVTGTLILRRRAWPSST